MDRRRANDDDIYIYIYKLVYSIHTYCAERATHFISHTHTHTHTHTPLMGRLIEEGGDDEKRLILYYYIGHGAKWPCNWWFGKTLYLVLL